MARKSFTESTGCSLIVIALAGLISLLPYLFTLSFYAFPLFLAYLLTFSGWDRRPIIESLDEDRVAAAMRALLSSKREISVEIESIKVRGAAEGVRYLHAQDRFEMRSRRGQQLNDVLDSARSRLDDVNTRIGHAQHPKFRRLPAWLQATSVWRRGRSFRRAFCVAVIGTITLVALLEMWTYPGKRTDLLVWNAMPTLISTGVEVGAIAGWVLGVLTLLISLRTDRRAEERDLENLGNDVDIQGPEAVSNSDSFDDPEEDSSAVGNPYEVLNISRQASTADIKDAYRRAMKRCHPDTVADRSQSIRDAAEAEAQRLNAAYDLVRNERGFS
jgi:hypothetical protein